MSNNKSLIIEMWNFIKVKRVWWLTPLIMLLTVVGILNIKIMDNEN